MRVESEHAPDWAIVEARSQSSGFNANLAIPKAFSAGSPIVWQDEHQLVAEPRGRKFRA